MTSFRQDCGSNKSAGNRRITKLKAFVVLNSEDFHEFDLGANVTREGFDLNLVANSNSVLFAAGFNNCVHVYTFNTSMQSAFC